MKYYAVKKYAMIRSVFWSITNWHISNWSINQKRKGNTQFLIEISAKIVNTLDGLAVDIECYQLKVKFELNSIINKIQCILLSL